MAQQPIFNRRSIAEFLALPWKTFDGDHLYTVVAEVEGINHESGWCHAACFTCGVKLMISNRGFYCRQCAKPCQDPVMRYKINLAVGDNTGEAIFCLFDPQAEQLLDKSANQLMRRLGLGSSEIPQEITNLVGRYFAFDIKVPELAVQGHRIVRITELALGAEGRKLFGKKRKRIVSGGAKVATTLQAPGSMGKSQGTTKIPNPEKEQTLKQRKLTLG